MPDDWDTDEPDVEDATDPEANQKIWNNAYVRFPSTLFNSFQTLAYTRSNAQAPMPNLVISPSQTSSATPGLSALPPAAFQAPIRILKRSQASTASSASASSSSSDLSRGGSTFAEREARYQAARDRIFHGGEDAKDQTSSGESIRAGPGVEGRTSNGGVSVVRAPRGPSSPAVNSSVAGAQLGRDDLPPKGFVGRNRPPPPSKGSPGQSSGEMQTTH